MATARLPVILGAGLSGLAAARELAARGHEPLVLERAPTVGGLTRTVEVGDFCFDYTGHFLHLSHYATPAAIPHAGLRDDEWQTVARRSSCFVGGAFVPAPIQYHLGDLPQPERTRCIESYEKRPALPNAVPVSFRDYIVSGFGQHLADLFLIPQNEKTLATPLRRLSRDAVKRFFPPPDDRLIRRGFSPGTPPAPGYNTNFWYPKTGGIERLIRGLRTGLRTVAVNQEAVTLDLKSRTLHTRTGERHAWDVLLTSMPLKQLCAISGDKDLVSAAQSLTHSSTISFNIGIRGELPAPFGGVHWVYVPDRALPFYRVGFYSEISRGTAAPGHSSMYVEVGVPADELRRTDIAGKLQPRVLAALAELGWLAPDRIVALVVHSIECAYVHHTPERDAAVRDILARLATHGITPIGRYGRWDYTSMEDSIRDSIAAVGALDL